MKAAVLKNWGEIEIQERPMPEIGPEEALIRVRYAGVCGSDLHVASGNHPTATVPRVLGHEFSGEIVKINSVIRNDLKEGDRVAVQPFLSCQKCEACKTGHDNVCTELKVFGVHTDGCFCEYMKVPARKVCKLPDSVDLELAAITEPLAVGVHDVRSSGIKVGEKALIMGGGPIGLIIGLVARKAGAKVVISEINEYRIKFAKDLGFTVMNPKDATFKEDLMAYTDGKGFDVVFEGTCVAPNLELMTKVCKIRGTIVTLTFPTKPVPVPLADVTMKEQKIIGVRIHSQVNFEAAIELLADKDFAEQVKKIHTHSFKLEDIDKAYDFSVHDGEHFKVFIEM